MFSLQPKFVCSVCHVRVKSKETLEKNMERHKNVTFNLKGKSYGMDSKALCPPEKEDAELPSPTYTASHSLVGMKPSSPTAKAVTTKPVKSKQTFIPPTKIQGKNDKQGSFSQAKSNAGNDKNPKKAPVKKSDQASKAKKSNIVSKQKFGNKEFKSTKTYNFFADLAKDVKLTTDKIIPAQAAESTESVTTTTNDSKSEKNNLPSNDPLQVSSKGNQPKTTPTRSKYQPAESEVQWNTDAKYREPRQLKPSRNNCGECEGCRTEINCLTCKFCLKPSLRKKCQKRKCHRKLKTNVPHNDNVDSWTINSLSDNTPAVGPSNHTPGQSVLTTDARKLFKCPKCNKSFIFPKWLVNHMKRDNCGEGASVKMKQCPVCRKLVRETYLKKHSKIHNVAMIKCDKCSGTFKTQETLQAHKNSIHEPKPISDQKCETCSKIFKHESLLKQHISKYHTSKDIKCDYCDMVFGTKGGLRRHMKNHEAILILECDENMCI